VITGAKRLEHLTSNVKAADWTLSANDLKEIEAILKGKNSITPIWHSQTKNP
jgi:aryl-alcohol dehydrogenase-like predicted oxidoreductase